jgi:hypothetical protein
MMARLYLFALATGLLWIGLAFASFAIFAYLGRTVGIDAAAALTSLIVLGILGAGASIHVAASEKLPTQPISLLNSGIGSKLQQLVPELAPEIAGLASRHPLFAIGIAAALGLAATSAPHGPAQNQTPKLHP